MSIWKIVLKNIAQRKLSSVLTAASIALGVAAAVAVLAIKAQSREAFRQGTLGYDLIVGSKGSRLQLVLNTVFHLDQSQGNVPFDRYKELAAHPAVELAVPLSVGDQYRGHRIVGTTDRFLTDFEIRPGERFELEGRPFRFSEDALVKAMKGGAEDGVFEAVLGATAAKRTGLRIGDRFAAAHGVVQSTGEHEEEWEVVGVLKPSGTPHDRAIFINLDSFYHIEDHRSGAEISAVLVRTKGEGGSSADRLAGILNEQPDVMAVKPGIVIIELFETIGKVDVLLLAVSFLVILVAGVSILVSIYNSMAERKRSIAIMRALGARRGTILSIVILEAKALCVFGGLAGLLLGHLLTAAAGGILSASAGVTISATAVRGEEFLIFAGVVALGALAGVVPALKAYRTDIADGLNPTS